MKILHFSLNFSQQRPLISNFTTMTIVKLCCHNFTQSAFFMIFLVSSISYRPTDLSLLKEFFKNVSFSNIYKLPSQSAEVGEANEVAEVMRSKRLQRF